MKETYKMLRSLCLCVLHSKDADIEITGKFKDYIAFGDWTDDQHGPVIRFHGGSEFTGVVDNAPILQFNIYGDCEIQRFEWMNEDNCPNMFDSAYVEAVKYFVQVNLPILFLVHNRNLDKADALLYFKGEMTWEDLTARIYRIPDELYSGLLSCQSRAHLHEFCVQEKIYGVSENKKNNRPLLSVALQRTRVPTFEIDILEEDELNGYNGNSETVRIPENVVHVGKDVFSGHSEIKKLIIPNTVTSIGESAFAGCTGIEYLLLPASIRFVGTCAFSGCANLKEVCFEVAAGADDDWVELDEGSFSNCENLESARLPAKLDIWSNPFINCPQLTILCQPGSYAERLAMEYQIPFSHLHN